MLNYSFQYLSNMINRSLLILSFISIVVLNSCNNAKTKNNASEIEQGSIEIENVDSDRIVKSSFSEQKEKTRSEPPKEVKPDTLKKKKASNLIINKTLVEKDGKIIEFHQSFNQKNEKGEYLSEPLELNLSNTSSGMLSAYCLHKSDYKLYYRVFKKDEWLNWEELPENTDVNNPKRKVFAPKQLEPTVLAIQFKSNKTTKQEVVFRIFTFSKD